MNACGSAVDTLVVNAQVQPSLPSTENICANDMTTLTTGVPNGTYMWSDGSMDSTLMVNAPGTYSVDIVDEYGCISSDTAVITQSVEVDLNATEEFCEDDAPYFLDANMNGSYVWSDGSTNQQLAVTQSGMYSVTVTDNFACISEDTSMVTMIENPVAAFGADSVSFQTVVFSDSSLNGTTYHWDFGDGETSNEMNPLHIYPNTDTVVCYTVTLTVSNQCDSATTSKEVCLGEYLSVGEVSENTAINVYPNPTQGNLTVSVNTAGTELNVDVVDLQGRTVMTRNFGYVSGQVQNNIDLSAMAKGVYLVKVMMDGETSVQRVTLK